MFKYIIMTMLTIFSAIPVLAHPCELSSGAERDSFTFKGDTRCGEGEVDLLEVEGPLKLVNTSITDTLFSQGRTFLKLAKINTSNLIGFVEATHSIFKDTIELDSAKAIFTQCKTKDILVDSSNHRISRLILDGTFVDGNIKFSDKKGVVELKNNAQVTGQVYGGMVIQDGETQNEENS